MAVRLPNAHVRHFMSEIQKYVRNSKVCMECVNRH